MPNILAEAFLTEQINKISREYAQPGKVGALSEAIVKLTQELNGRISRMQDRWNRAAKDQRQLIEHLTQCVEYCQHQGELTLAEAYQAILNRVQEDGRKSLNRK